MSEWIIPCNINEYNVFGAFNELTSINWVQKVKKMKVNDIAYIYVGVPYKAIRYKCLVKKVNLEIQEIDDSKFVIDDANYGSYAQYAEFELLERYNTPLLSLYNLNKNGLRQYPIRSQHQITNELSRYISRISKIVLDAFEDSNLLSEINLDIVNLSQSQPQYKGKKKEKVPPVIKKGQKNFIRDRQTAINALSLAKYECEIDNEHPTFIRKNTELKYTEPHHLVPLCYSDRFDVSLDVEENIVSLCSNCHNQIHYGKGADELIEMYN